jgi:hypothetical protein
MTRDPVLAAKTLPKGADGYNVARTMRVEGGLHHIKGNKAPYFSLTMTAHRKGFPDQCYSGGADHETILKHYPRFADLAALHLSSIDGEPMHAVENGWYQLAGCYPDGFGARYHAGNSDRRCSDGAYRHPTGDECLESFARHCRINLTEAASIRDDVKAAAMASRDNRQAIAKARLAEIMDAMRPRWKAEAEACIAHHALKVYGDPLPVAA